MRERLLVNGSYMKGLDWDDERRYIMTTRYWIMYWVRYLLVVVFALGVMKWELIWNWLLG